MGEALQRSAASMSAAGNTLEQSVALITAANTIVQNPEVVGKNLLTLKVAQIGGTPEMGNTEGKIHVYGHEIP